MDSSNLYKPLSPTEFRIIHILPGAFSDEIRCVLETRPSGIKTRYEALSYQWGDASLTRPILLAALDSDTPSQNQPSPPAPTQATQRPIPPWHPNTITILPLIDHTLRALSLRTTTSQHQTEEEKTNPEPILHLTLQLLIHALGAYAIYTLLTTLPYHPPDWVPATIPPKAYFFVLALLVGSGPPQVLLLAVRLVLEVVRTRAWGVLPVLGGGLTHRRLVRLGVVGAPAAAAASSHGKETSDDNGEVGSTTTAGEGEGGGKGGLHFETKQVSVNLALALRYLRRERSVRTVWVDAVCINQGDDEEKRMQVQRMDLVYANAGAVVVWLGGYHGIGEGNLAGCEEEKVEEGSGGCEHQQRIRDAFDSIWRLSGWRVMLGFWLGRDKKARVAKARAGLRDIYKRGWWERLWVIQEVALATGPVRIQCGHCICEFGDFQSAQYLILSESRGIKEMEDDAGAVERFGNLVNDIRYSSFHDRQDQTTMLVYNFLKKTLGVLFRTDKPKDVDFHKQPFAGRLQRILLRTAGYYLCRDDRDRLYAVLGVAGGAKMGEATQVADFVRFISSFSTAKIITHTVINPILEASPGNLPLKVALHACSVAHVSWAAFYDSRAKHWTINRPEYVVTRHKEVIDAVAGEPGATPGPSRVEFFAALARYLVNQTKTLSFLDAASCGEDEDKNIPSWVPNWTRKVHPEACAFAGRSKDGLAHDSFWFGQDGKTLWLVARPRGTVHFVRPATEAASPVQTLLERWLALPVEGKRALVSCIRLFAELVRKNSDHALDEARVEYLSSCLAAIRAILNFGKVLLERERATLVYSVDKTAGEMGFLRAGGAAKGDRMVFVPGCFHHLVLRKQDKTNKTDNRWKLVGLVAMGLDKRKKGGCSVTEWAQLRKDGAVFKYAIA